MNIGKKLKNARKEKNISLDKIQDETKIRKKYLVALENNNFDEINGKVYVRAFLKGYADVVGLDCEEIINEYEIFLKKKEYEKKTEVKKEDEKFYKKNSFKIIIFIIILAIISFFLYSHFFNSNKKTINTTTGITEKTNNESISDVKNNQENKEIKDQSKLPGVQSNQTQNENNTSINKKYIDNFNEKTKNNIDFHEINNDLLFDINDEHNNNIKRSIKTEEEDISNNNKKNSSSQDKKSTEKKENSNEINEQKSIKIIAKQKSWIRIYNKKNIIYQDIINKGENKIFNLSEDKIFIKIGNAIAIKIEYKGKTFGPWGEKGEVIEKAILLEDKLSINNVD